MSFLPLCHFLLLLYHILSSKEATAGVVILVLRVQQDGEMAGFLGTKDLLAYLHLLKACQL